MENLIPTREQVMAARTEAGGWTRDQLAQWGVPWPPERGWIDRLVVNAGRPVEPIVVPSKHRKRKTTRKKRRDSGKKPVATKELEPLYYVLGRLMTQNHWLFVRAVGAQPTMTPIKEEGTLLPKRFAELLFQQMQEQLNGSKDWEYRLVRQDLIGIVARRSYVA